MKKKTMIASGLVTIAVVVFVGVNMQEAQTETKALKYADARLSVLELQQGIEVKIAFLLDEVKKTNIKPTEKGLIQLVQSISMVRAYGKDISKEAKENLSKIVKQLKNNGFVDDVLLKKLDEVANSSVEHVV